MEASGATRIADAKALVDQVAIRDVLRVLDLYRVNCVVDVGANVGQYAQRLRAMGWAGRIVSFEPLPSAFEAIRAASASDPDWRVVNVALGRADGEAKMNVVAGKGMTSSLLAASQYGRRWSRRLTATTPLSVQVRRLEALLPDLVEGIDDPRVYLKLDTQGYDLGPSRASDAASTWWWPCSRKSRPWPSMRTCPTWRKRWRPVAGTASTSPDAGR